MKFWHLWQIFPTTYLFLLWKEAWSLEHWSVFLFFLSLDVDASTPTSLSLSLLRRLNRPGNACISCWKSCHATPGRLPHTQWLRDRATATAHVWRVLWTCCELQTNFWGADASGFDSLCFLLQAERWGWPVGAGSCVQGGDDRRRRARVWPNIPQDEEEQQCAGSPTRRCKYWFFQHIHLSNMKPSTHEVWRHPASFFPSPRPAAAAVRTFAVDFQTLASRATEAAARPTCTRGIALCMLVSDS